MEKRRGEVRSHIQPGGKCPWEVIANGSAIHTVNSGRMSLWPPVGATRKFNHFLFYTLKN